MSIAGRKQSPPSTAFAAICVPAFVRRALVLLTGLSIALAGMIMALYREVQDPFSAGATG